MIVLRNKRIQPLSDPWQRVPRGHLRPHFGQRVPEQGSIRQIIAVHIQVKYQFSNLFKFRTTVRIGYMVLEYVAKSVTRLTLY